MLIFILPYIVSATRSGTFFRAVLYGGVTWFLFYFILFFSQLIRVDRCSLFKMISGLMNATGGRLGIVS